MARLTRVLVLAGCLSLTLSGSAAACLWYYGTNLHKNSIRVGALPPEIYVRDFSDRSEHELRANEELGVQPGAEADFKLRSDYATSLIYKGKVRAAIEILESVEKQKPGEYVVAANLGTAFELNGENSKALHWISEGLKRNPASHAGTEWLHVLILQAKIALAEDPDWLKTHSVLGVDFGREREPSSPLKWPKGQHAWAVQEALEYQLRERLGFVAAPDPVVADLLFDLGNLLAITLTVEHALAVYDLAISYRPVQLELVGQRRLHMQSVIAGRIRNQMLVKYALTLAGVLVAGSFVFFLRRRGAQPARFSGPGRR